MNNNKGDGNSIAFVGLKIGKNYKIITMLLVLVIFFVQNSYGFTGHF
jgi:hypothetical protein